MIIRSRKPSSRPTLESKESKQQDELPTQETKSFSSRLEKIGYDSQLVPHYLCCPILLTIMNEPYLVNKVTLEKKTTLQWFNGKPRPQNDPFGSAYEIIDDQPVMLFDIDRHVKIEIFVSSLEKIHKLEEKLVSSNIDADEKLTQEVSFDLALELGLFIQFIKEVVHADKDRQENEKLEEIEAITEHKISKLRELQKKFSPTHTELYEKIEKFNSSLEAIHRLRQRLDILLDILLKTKSEKSNDTLCDMHISEEENQQLLIKAQLEEDRSFENLIKKAKEKKLQQFLEIKSDDIAKLFDDSNAIWQNIPIPDEEHQKLLDEAKRDTPKNHKNLIKKMQKKKLEELLQAQCDDITKSIQETKLNLALEIDSLTKFLKSVIPANGQEKLKDIKDFTKFKMITFKLLKKELSPVYPHCFHSKPFDFENALTSIKNHLYNPEDSSEEDSNDDYKHEAINPEYQMKLSLCLQQYLMLSKNTFCNAVNSFFYSQAQKVLTSPFLLFVCLHLTSQNPEATGKMKFSFSRE